MSLRKMTTKTLKQRYEWRDIGIVLITAWTLRLLFMAFVPDGARSFDAFSWQSVSKCLAEGLNPYHVTTVLNWPPFWMQLIFCISKAAAMVGIPFFRALQIFLILVESVVIVQAFKMIRYLAPAANARNILLFGIALNPVAILLTCQHCNFDVIVGLWVVLFAGCLVKFNRTGNVEHWLGACLFLGLGILTKTVPLILIPMLAGGFRQATNTIRFAGAFLVLAPVTLGMSVIYALSPAEVSANVLAYRSIGYAPSFYGIPGLLHFAGADQFLLVQHFAFYGLIAICLVVTWNLSWNRRIGEKETVLLPALILLSIPTFGTGAGPQYAWWFLPLLVVSYSLYGLQWKRLLKCVGFVNACTYIVEYALLAALGYFLLYFLVPTKTPDSGAVNFPSLEMQNFFQAAWSENGQIAMGLLMFLANVVLFVFGFRLLNISSYLYVRPMKVFYALVLVLVALSSVAAFSIKKPVSTQVSNPKEDPISLKSRVLNAADLNNQAWLLATSPDDKIRDGNLAVEMAKRACELTHYRTPITIGTLGAAYAEAGRFDDAISAAQDACKVAGQLNQTNILDRNRQLLELYQSHKPYRENVSTYSGSDN